MENIQDLICKIDMKASYYTAITCRKNLLRQKPVAFMVICEIILNSKKNLTDSKVIM